MNNLTILSVWNDDGGYPEIVSRELNDYNIKYPESLLIFETKVSERADGLIIEHVGIDEIDESLNANDFPEADKYDYAYAALVDGVPMVALHYRDLADKLREAYGEGILNGSKVKPYEWPAPVMVITDEPQPWDEGTSK